MNELLVGYARVSTEQQDLTSQRNGLHALGVGDDRIYVDHGLTGTNRDRPGLRLALAACRAGDTLVVTKLDRLARSLPDARDILDELTKRNVKLSLGGSIHDPTDPVGRLLFNVLAMVAEFEADLIRMRTREGMKIAKAKGRLRGKQPKLKPNQAKHLLELHDLGTYTQAELVTCPRRLPRPPTLTSPCSPTTAAGTLHTKLEPLPGGDLIGAQLDSARGLCSIDCVYALGRFYNLGPRRHRDRLRGQHLDAPRLIRQRGALLPRVPSPREATVPHRELPGLRLG